MSTYDKFTNDSKVDYLIAVQAEKAAEKAAEKGYNSVGVHRDAALKEWQTAKAAVSKASCLTASVLANMPNPTMRKGLTSEQLKTLQVFLPTTKELKLMSQRSHKWGNGDLLCDLFTYLQNQLPTGVVFFNSGADGFLVTDAGWLNVWELADAVKLNASLKRIEKKTRKHPHGVSTAPRDQRSFSLRGYTFLAKRKSSARWGKTPYEGEALDYSVIVHPNGRRVKYENFSMQNAYNLILMEVGELQNYTTRRARVEDQTSPIFEPAN
jgi:hypothetical protein